jgi:hypothetical protein
MASAIPTCVLQHPDPKVAEAAETNGPVPPGPYPWKVKLVTSTDGLNWDLVTHLDVPGRPNEATVRIRPDGEMIAMVRRERGNYFGWIGSSKSAVSRVAHGMKRSTALAGRTSSYLPDNSLIASRPQLSAAFFHRDRQHGP